MENALSISRNPTQANPIKRNNILQNPIRLHTLQSPTFMEENAMTGIRRDVNQGGTVWNETLIWYSKADRKSTRLNSSHLVISYAVFCLKKKKQHIKCINMYNNHNIRIIEVESVA